MRQANSPQGLEHALRSHPLPVLPIPLHIRLALDVLDRDDMLALRGVENTVTPCVAAAGDADAVDRARGSAGRRR